MGDKNTIKRSSYNWTQNWLVEKHKSEEFKQLFCITPHGTVEADCYLKERELRLYTTLPGITYMQTIKGKWLKFSDQAIKTRCSMFLKEVRSKKCRKQYN